MTDVQERVREYILRHTKDSHTDQKAVKEQQLKHALVGRGEYDSADVKAALEALGENEQIQYGSGWIVPVVDREYHQDAIAYVVENATGDVQEFVAVANTAIAEGDV
jgi:hypothetical protein